MLGAVLLALAIVVMIPIGLSLSGAVAAGILGWTLKEDAEERFEGSELVELNK